MYPNFPYPLPDPSRAKKAVEEARKRGAVGELVPEVRVNRTMVRDEQSGRNLPIGTVVEAEITQRA